MGGIDHGLFSTDGDICPTTERALAEGIFAAAAAARQNQTPPRAWNHFDQQSGEEWCQRKNNGDGGN
jgi:hypothetical protein